MKSKYLLAFFGCFAFSAIHAEPSYPVVRSDSQFLSSFWQKAAESNEFVNAFTDPVLQLIAVDDSVTLRPFVASQEVERPITLLVE